MNPAEETASGLGPAGAEGGFRPIDPSMNYKDPFNPPPPPPPAPEA